MPYFVLGIALLAGVLLAGRWFVTADPKTLVKVLKWGLIGTIVAVALFFLLTGRVAWAIWALPALIPWFLRARSFARAAKNFSRMGGGASGQASNVDSDYLHMTLDHDSGEMDGTVRRGRFEGRKLSDLDLAALIQLFDDYERRDGESARLLAAYLDRMHPDWRDEAPESAGTEGPAGDAGGDGPMTRAEAYRVLGLDDGAGADEIKAAHHRLIAGLHPDKGGSAYLAAKINEARDVLLKG